MRLKARYFAWLEELAPEGALPGGALDDLENAFFGPFEASVRAVEEWLSLHGGLVCAEGHALARAVPLLFDGRTVELAQRVGMRRNPPRQMETTAAQVEPFRSAIQAELAFLDAFARWRLEQPAELWDRLLSDPNVRPHLRVVARARIEKAASSMNRGALVEALAALEAARATEHLWDGWARTRAGTVRYTSHLYLGNHAQAARHLDALRPRSPREKRAPSVVLAHLRRQLSLEQEREALRRARRLLAQARGQSSGAALSRLLVDKESLRIALRSENTDEAEALLGIVATPNASLPSGAGRAQDCPALVPTASEELEVLLLGGHAKEAHYRARAFEASTRGTPNVLLRCEARVLLAECALLESEPGHAHALAADARAFADTHGLRPLALRARLVEALGLAWESPAEGGRALALLAQELQALRLPLSRARVGLLRARLGVCEGAESEIVASWTTLASEGASCVRADQIIARFALARSLRPRGFRLASFTDESVFSAGSDAVALRQLGSTHARVWFPVARALLATNPDGGTTLLGCRSDSLADTFLSSLLDAGAGGRTLEDLHALRSHVPFRPDDHAPALHVALARLRARLAPLGMGVSHSNRTETYHIVSEGLLLRYEDKAPNEARVRKGRTRDTTSVAKGEGTGPSGVATKRKAEILGLLSRGAILTSADIALALGITRQSLRPYVSALEEEGAILRWGKGPGTRYAAR